MRRSVSVGVLSVTAAAFLAVPSLALAQDDDAAASDEATATEEVVTESPPATEPAGKPAAEPAPVVEEPADDDSAAPPAPADDGGHEPAPAPEPAAAPAPAPAPAPVVESKETSSAGNVAPATAVAEDTGGGGIGESSGAIRSSRGSVAGTSGGVCGREDVGPVPGSNQEVHGDLEASGCTASAVGVTTSPVTVGGITFTFTVADNGQGDVLSFTTSAPFTGTLLVKGGSEQNDGGHFRCDFFEVTEGTCHAAVNPSNDKFFGFSHLDICVREAGTPPPPPPPPPDGDTPNGGGTQGGGGGGGDDQPGGGGGGGGGDVLQEEERGEAPAPPPAPTPAVAAPAAAAEELPFTGIDLGWLALMAASLLLGGALLRRTAS